MYLHTGDKCILYKLTININIAYNKIILNTQPFHNILVHISKSECSKVTRKLIRDGRISF